MASLEEIVSVPLPAVVTEQNALHYFENRRQSDGTIAHALRVPLRDFGLPDSIAIERVVTVAVEKRRDAESINDEIFIAWAAADGGRFPAFTGKLIVWSEDRSDVCFIELIGTYQPPYGAAGALFDAAIGHSIAQRTARGFLDDLRDAVVAMQREARRKAKAAANGHVAL